jgi:hypothetical protein
VLRQCVAKRITGNEVITVGQRVGVLSQIARAASVPRARAGAAVCYFLGHVLVIQRAPQNQAFFYFQTFKLQWLLEFDLFDKAATVSIMTLVLSTVCFAILIRNAWSSFAPGQVRMMTPLLSSKGRWKGKASSVPGLDQVCGKGKGWLSLAENNGGAEEGRTPGLRIANAALCQLSYCPTRKRIQFRVSSFKFRGNLAREEARSGHVYYLTCK